MDNGYNYYKMFGCFSRKFKISEAEPPSDVKEAFCRFAEGAKAMRADQFLRFLAEHQGEEWRTAADVEAIMLKVVKARHHSVDRNRSFSLDDFFFFLLQDDLNGPINPQVHHDMTAPLHHYYIFTGHNSYLTGNQLSSDCSEIPIIRALENGVRGIELDLWPNSAKDNIHVLHGRTLTTPISLIKCLNSIKQHAFVKSPYPVIITLEDHLPPELQAKVAEMTTAIFGDMLFHPESGHLEEFPSPEELKHRIILSTKPPKEYLRANSSKDANNNEECSLQRDSSDNSKDEENSLVKDWSDNNKDGENSPAKDSSDNNKDRENSLGKDSSDNNKEDGGNSLVKDCSDDENGTGCKSDSDDESGDTMQQTSVNYSKTEYKRLIAIHARNAKNKRLRHVLAIEGDRPGRLSLSEQEIEKAASSYATNLVRFTQKNLLRIFPKGTRVTSSNFRPTIGWIHGAQMVAFNMQGYGKSLWMMQGLFRSNGGCGYVRKPEMLMRRGPKNEVFSPKSWYPVRRTLKVTMYMGDGWRMDFSHTHFDKHSPPDFYTKVYIFGFPSDQGKSKTRVMTNEWIPCWDHEFSFPLRVLEVDLLRIEVREYNISEKDDFGGQTCLLVSELRPGIRSVPLYNRKGHKYKSVRLLMGFAFE